MYAILIRVFLDGVRFTSSAGFVTSHVVAVEEDTIAGNDFTWFQKSDIANHNFLSR